MGKKGTAVGWWCTYKKSGSGQAGWALFAFGTGCSHMGRAGCASSASGMGWSGVIRVRDTGWVSFTHWTSWMFVFRDRDGLIGRRSRSGRAGQA